MALGVQSLCPLERYVAGIEIIVRSIKNTMNKPHRIGGEWLLIASSVIVLRDYQSNAVLHMSEVTLHSVP